MKNIIIFGASITHGVGGAQGGWADHIKQAVHEKLYGADGAGETGAIYELGVPGDSAAQLLIRIESELEARAKKESATKNCIVISVGANDAKASGGPTDFVTSSEEFAQTVKQLLAVAKSYAKAVLVVGLTPVDESKTNPRSVAWNGRFSYFKNERLKKFNDVLQQTCKGAGVPMVSVFDEVPQKWTSSMLFSDGLHPNAAGHLWISQRVKPRIFELADT